MTRPWSELRQFYAKHEQGKCMLDLVCAIESSPYSQGLHGWQSMLDLCITQTAVKYPYDGPYLKVSPSAGRLEFRYVDTRVNDKQWHRTVDCAEGFNRLEAFLDQLHWFVKE